MLKKYINIYIESIKLAIAQPVFVIFFILLNSSVIFNTLEISNEWLGLLAPVVYVTWLAVMSANGYVTIRLLRNGHTPRWKEIFTKGVAAYYWRLLKYSLLWGIIVGLTWFIPENLIERYSPLHPIISSFWLTVIQFLFIFLIYEAIFWEDKGVMHAFRMRNIYMLDRFEWMFPIYLWMKLPHFIVNNLYLWGIDVTAKWWWAAIFLIFLACMDWVNNIYTFKIYGTERLQVAKEMEERIRELDKERKNKLEKRKKKLT